jgi:hypothetical protein
MANNKNRWVEELLSWHGHDRGGVHVPFQTRAKPLSSTIETVLINKLIALASQLSLGNDSCPRWIFLIGGPGNGKSETVESFLTALDTQLGMAGELTAVLSRKFAPQPLVPRRVEVTGSDFAVPDNAFASKIGRLIVVQDATATDLPMDDAAKKLFEDLEHLLTDSPPVKPVFVACVNRGLLSAAMREAAREYDVEQDPTRLFAAILQATSLGRETLATTRPACWPLDSYPHVACWPMDLDSLLNAPTDSTPPLVQILQVAAAVDKWEAPEACTGCDASPLCPFRQNAAWLRDQATMDSLRTILRRGELATGQRWNFRDAFSLAASLMVGERADFPPRRHPCEWVHDQIDPLPDIGADDDADALPRLHALVYHLYPQALFNGTPYQSIASRYREDIDDWSGQPISEALVSVLSWRDSLTDSSVRDFLQREYALIDPSFYTPEQPAHPLYEIETHYSQSVTQGNEHPPLAQLSLLEVRYLNLLASAECEWDLTQLNTTQVFGVMRLIRQLAASVRKKSEGVRLGHHAEEDVLKDFEDAIRNRAKLKQLKDSLEQLLGTNGFQFNAVESFGQPRSDRGWIARWDGGDVPLQVYEAPLASDRAPAHDLPCFALKCGHMQYRMPITFTLFRALLLRDRGCMNSSLPASVRTSLDRIRHLYAGAICRDRGRLVDGTVKAYVGDSRLQLDDECGMPYLQHS